MDFSKNFIYVENKHPKGKPSVTSPEFKQMLGSLCAYLCKQLGIKKTPSLKILDSPENSKEKFGYTGYYDHKTRTITLYVTDRHDTDVLRTFSHEMVHHWQNERGTLHPEDRGVKMPMDNTDGEHYAQHNPWLRKREMEAYLYGCLLFRDWQDEQRYGPPKTPNTLPQPYD